MLEYNAADRGPDDPAGDPEADVVPAGLLGTDTDRAVVLRRIDLGNEVARYRELAAAIKGETERPRYQEEFAWVVAALKAWPGR
ncbi:acetyltransferase [Streptomyces sp. NPDC001544]|uniref:acetyltransferase n=1 Tax=Streptomyces sp. NPDC001544 TaxID=3364584 RepID=UPI00369429D7